MMWKKVPWGVFLLLFLAGASPAAGDNAEANPQDPLQIGPVKPGMDALARAEMASNFNLGNFTFTPGNDEGRILFRFRPSVAVNSSRSFSARVEGQWYAFAGDTDFSLFSIYQGYAEGALPVGKGISLKAGRQELVYGSAFMIGADTFYDGQVFDAAKLSFKPSKEVSLDLFGGEYVKKWAGDIEGRLYGIYAIYVPGETLSMDLYGFRDTGGPGATHVRGAREEAYFVGIRLSGKAGKLVSYEVEPVHQFGKKKLEGTTHNDIRAWGGHGDLTMASTLGRYPVKGLLAFAFGTGDGNPVEGRFTEFHNPNNDTSLIGDMNVVGDLSGIAVSDPTGNDVRASGLQVSTVGGGIDLTESQNLSLHGHYFRAAKVPAGIGKELGFEVNLILTRKIRDGISLVLSANRFFTGKFFRDATGSGKDIDSIYAQLQGTF